MKLTKEDKMVIASILHNFIHQEESMKVQITDEGFLRLCLISDTLTKIVLPEICIVPGENAPDLLKKFREKIPAPPT